MVQHGLLGDFSCRAGIFSGGGNQIFWCHTHTVSSLAVALFFGMKVNYCCCLPIEEVYSQDNWNGKLLWKCCLLTWKPVERQFCHPLKLHMVAHVYGQSPFVSPRGRPAVVDAEPKPACESCTIADGLGRDVPRSSHFTACSSGKSCKIPGVRVNLHKNWWVDVKKKHKQQKNKTTKKKVSGSI